MIFLERADLGVIQEVMSSREIEDECLEEEKSLLSSLDLNMDYDDADMQIYMNRDDLEF